jgi:flavin-binding protein dodecin
MNAALPPDFSVRNALDFHLAPSASGLASSSGEADPPFHKRAKDPEDFLLCLIAFSRNNGHMSEHIYKKIELVGSSPNGFEEAVRNALARAEKTVRNMRWFEVAETRGYIENGKVGHWQVTLKIGFTLDDA